MLKTPPGREYDWGFPRTKRSLLLILPLIVGDGVSNRAPLLVAADDNHGDGVADDGDVNDGDDADEGDDDDDDDGGDDDAICREQVVGCGSCRAALLGVSGGGDGGDGEVRGVSARDLAALIARAGVFLTKSGGRRGGEKRRT